MSFEVVAFIIIFKYYNLVLVFSIAFFCKYCNNLKQNINISMKYILISIQLRSDYKNNIKLIRANCYLDEILESLIST